MKKDLLALFLVLALVLGLAACGAKTGTQPATTDTSAQTTQDDMMMGDNSMTSDSSSSDTALPAGYHTITPEQAKARLDSGDPVILVDVRTAEEYAQAHIKGAILIPNETIDKTQPKELPDLNAEIIVYCRSGRRSRDASIKLAEMGYTNIYDLGGIKDWPYGTVSGS